MSTTSKRLAAQLRAASGGKPSHTPGIKKGGFCVRPPDHGIATKGNPYKGNGMKPGRRSVYLAQWARYKSAKGAA